MLIRGILIVQLLLLVVFAQAQRRGLAMTSQEIAERDLTELTKELSLTQQQVDSITSVVYYYADEKQEIYDTFGGDAIKLNEEMAKTNQRLDKAIGPFLTEVQRESLAAYRKRKAANTGSSMRRQ